MLIQKRKNLPMVCFVILIMLSVLAFSVGGCRNLSAKTVVIPPAVHSPGTSAPSAGASSALQSLRFESVAASSGIGYVYPALPRPLGIKETFGCGCAFLDYDNDGWMDILLVARPHPFLYHNLGNGHFEDVTKKMGLANVRGDWHGCAVGDYDSDGYLDIVFNGFHALALMHNDSGKKFTDATRAAGLDVHNSGHWGSGAGFIDLDGDGKLDLVLLEYVLFGPEDKDLCLLGPNILTSCRPQDFRPDYAQIWHNKGVGRFENVTVPSKIAASTHGKALVLAFSDLENTGRPDIYIGNDGTLADMLHNLGSMHFENVGARTGLDSTNVGSTISSMGADWGDYDGDGKLDLAVTNFSGMSYPLYHNSGKGYFEHTESALGIASPTFNTLGFGVKWADIDNDGFPELVYANGHVYDAPERLDGYSKMKQPLMLFHNHGGKRFEDVAPALGGDLAKPLLGRGLAAGDFDNDGRIDLLVVDYEGQPLLLHNLTQTRNHWITLDLHGASPNRFAYGARVRARAGARIWAGYVSPASSYLSSSDPRLHFGLGTTAKLDMLEINWPDGHRQILKDIDADCILRVDEAPRH